MDPIAVTGAGGYLGGRLVAHLHANGERTRSLVRRAVPWLPDATVIDLAASDVDTIAAALAGCAAVVHLAGASEVRAAHDPDGALADTAAAARRTAAAAAAAGIDRFVFVSTVHVYGASLARVPVIDESVLPLPSHPYAIARLAGEHLVAAEVPSAIVLRLTNAVGAPTHAEVDRWTLVANDLAAQAARGGPLRLRTSGLQWRDFIDMGDACRSIAAAASGDVPAGTFNLGRGRSRTVRDLAELVADAAEQVRGVRPEVVAPAHDGPVSPQVTIDVSRLADHVAAPVVPIEASLREVVAFCVRAIASGASIGDG